MSHGHHHGHSHGHSHGHGAGAGDDRGGNLRRLAFTLGLVLLYMVAEVVGGLLTGSLALLADAGHMLSDAASLGLAVFALWIARRPSSPNRTFGYHRTEILAALANGITLVAVAVFIVVEAVERFQSPQPVDGQTMLWIAVGGLVVNLAGLKILHGGQGESLNLRGAWLHVLADTLGSVQAIVAGALIWAYGWNLADPIASVLIAVLVVWSSWTLLRDSVNVLMEATPRHLDAEEVQATLAAVDGVVSVHDLHIWTITSGFESLSVHACIEDRDRGEILDEIRAIARNRFGIEHSTVQIEEGDPCDQADCG
ncbi:MAG: cation diffusion facilitator family transporter [Acidobacteriota bacterium]|nr:cation diffusion facilitator family transporter [Acidobacteriota bacterium]